MRRLGFGIVVLSAFLLTPVISLAQWTDDFDSYTAGSGLHGQGGWVGWDNNPGADAFVTNLRSRSAPNSEENRSTSDIVQQFTGINSGQWAISGWCYIPTGGFGNQFFILLNTYNHGGPYNWSLDLQFNQTSGQVVDFDDPNTPTRPIIYNQWVEVRVVIDFDTDFQQIYYNGALFASRSWTEGASGGGVLNLAALDLYSEAASTIYWDDLALDDLRATPVQQTTWGGVKAAFRR
jgi:hypothetical protein